MSTVGQNKSQPILEKLFSIDLRALAAWRIALGTLLLMDYCYRIPDILAHYSDLGVIPRWLLLPWPVNEGYPTLYLISGHPTIAAVFFGLGILFAIGLIIGFRTRWMIFLSWILLISLHYRNRYVLNSGDDLLRCMIFWSLFVPLEKRWSWDSRKTPLKLSGSAFSFATAGMLFQVFALYFFSAIEKTGDAWREHGTATFFALTRPRFATPLADTLLQYPEFLKPITFAVLFFEFLGPLLLFSPFKTARIRIILVTLFALMQCGFRLGLELGLFPWIAIATSVIFLPSSFWNYIGGKVQLLPKDTRALSPDSIYKSSKLSNTFTMSTLIYILIMLLSSPQILKFQLPLFYKMPGRLAGIEQRWKMFSPNPSRTGGWYVIPAKLKDGTVVDIFNDGLEVTWERPKVISSMYPNQRWRQLLAKMRKKKRKMTVKKAYADYLCRDWNSKIISPDKEVISLEVYFMEEKILDDGTRSKPKKIKLVNRQC